VLPTRDIGAPSAENSEFVVISRFSEKVEWWGTASLRSSRQNQNVDSAQQVALRDHVIEPEFVEKVHLLSMLSSHHRRIFPL
jgi:hypothetical protein